MRSPAFLLCVLLASVAAVSNARAEMPSQYSARQTVTAAGTSMTNTVYADGGKMRVETDMQGMKLVTLVRPDKGVTYQLMPGNLYLETPFSGVQAAMSGFYDESKASYEDLGEETLDGAPCLKQKVTSEGTSFYLWTSKADQRPVKMEALDGTYSIAWQGFTAGPQKPEFFEIPAGYQKADMGAADPAKMQAMAQSMMQSLMPQAGQNGQALPSGTMPPMPSLPGLTMPTTTTPPQTPPATP